MDVSDFESAFTLPFAKETSFDTVVVGILLTLASFTTPLAGLLLVGYVVRLVRAGERGASALPGFDDFIQMSVEGAKLSVGLVVLQLPAVGVAAGVLKVSGDSVTALAAVSDPRLLSFIEISALAIVGLVAAGIVALVGTYLSAALTVSFSREQSLLAAIPVAKALAFDKSFAQVVSAVALVVFAGRLLLFLFGTFPILGVALAATMSFLTLVAAATLLGRGAPSASETTIDSAEMKTEPVASV